MKMNIIKQCIGILMVALVSISVNAQDLPKPSPSASFTQTFGVTNVTMDYSRPSVKGREIWGGLVPYNEVWRAGANASTKIEFSTDVKIGGVDVKAGKYALFIIPSEGEWTFIISTYTDGWGTTGYTEKSDVVRVMASVSENSFTENMNFSLDNITDGKCMVNLYWEKIKVGFAVEANTNELAKVILENKIEQADDAFSTYNSAANWYLKTGDSAKALELATKSVNSTKKFWNLTVLAEAYAATGDMKTAIKTAKEALAMSEEAKYDSYIERNKKNLEEWSK